MEKDVPNKRVLTISHYVCLFHSNDEFAHMMFFVLEIIVREERYSVAQKLKHYLCTLNMFPSIPPSTDEHQLQNERTSTRIFIVLLTLLLTILLLYTSLINVTQTVTVKINTIAKYSQLYSTYPQTLTCPCTQISINYGTFLDVQYTFHQVCSSVFVDEYWINYLYNSYGNGAVYTYDFRYTSPMTFQGLSALCGLVNQTISNSLTQFYLNQYISASVIPSQVFESQVNASVSQFISSTANDFLLSLTTIRNTTQSNAIYSREGTNYYFYTQPTLYNPDPHAESYSNCSCSSSPTCVEPSSIYDYSNGAILFSVAGIYIGCYIIESLLQSDLRCFYNQTCINQLQSYLISSSSMNITALDKTLLVQFLENSTIEVVVDQLMVQQWNQSKMYDRYYNACQPAECIYTHQTKNNPIYIITTLIGLLGGLITVLKLIVPRLVIFLCKKQEQPRPHIGKRISEKTISLYVTGVP
jgi:hypothetical protein